MSRSVDGVRAEVREVVLDLAPKPDRACGPDARLLEDLEYHSLALLELVFALEHEFDLPPLDEVDAPDIVTVGNVEDYVVAQLQARRP